MKIKRELVLPISPDTTRQRLASAFMSPTILLKKGNLFLARVECSGDIEDDSITAKCTVFGRGFATYTMNGNLISHPNGVRVAMTVQNNFSELIYVPILIIAILRMSTNSSGLTNYLSFFNLFAFLFLGSFLYFGLQLHLSSAANQFEELIKKCVVPASPNSLSESV